MLYVYLYVYIILIRMYVFFFGIKLCYRILNNVLNVIYLLIKGRNICLISIYYKIIFKFYYKYNIIFNYIKIFIE